MRDGILHQAVLGEAAFPGEDGRAQFNSPVVVVPREVDDRYGCIGKSLAQRGF